jgi:asparagine synthase (glutamine-hydrolysing)
MCGFAGALQTGLSNEEWSENLRRMAEVISHRGPDNEGFWWDSEAGVGLAHRRLSIIDLSREGNQPMISSSGRYVIVYNGEVYNFPDLRAELEKQQLRKWRGHSDTEVILEAIEDWGLWKAVTKFIGMFAFALWDRQERVLYLARDRLGIKPLYYGKINGVFLFGSELKALRAHNSFEKEIERDALTLFLRHNYIPAPYSIYKGIFKLTPGSILKVQGDSRSGAFNVSSEAYWSAREVIEKAQKQPFQGTEDEAVDLLDEVLRDAVSKRLVSDVSIGSFLSGGLDSSTVVALMQAQSAQPVKSFTIGFYEKGYNEAEHAKRVAKHLGTNHTELYITPEEAMEVIPTLPDLFDEPFSDSSQIPTFAVAKLTKQFVTVSLSGDGGDELFGGYDRYFLGRGLWGRINWMPDWMKTSISGFIRASSFLAWEQGLRFFEPLLPGVLKERNLQDRLKRLAGLIQKADSVEFYRYLVSHWKEPTKVVVGAVEPETIFTSRDGGVEALDFTHLMMFIDLITYLPDDILTKVDRTSMGVSLEARVPILDHRVVEFAWRLPISMKFKRGHSKWLLRRVLYRYVPRDIVERPKKGFTVPLAKWLRGPLRGWAEELLSEARLKREGFFNPLPIREKWREHLSGKKNWHYYLWDILMFQAWLERWG